MCGVVHPDREHGADARRAPRTRPLQVHRGSAGRPPPPRRPRPAARASSESQIAERAAEVVRLGSPRRRRAGALRRPQPSELHRSTPRSARRLATGEPSRLRRPISRVTIHRTIVPGCRRLRPIGTGFTSRDRMFRLLDRHRSMRRISVPSITAAETVDIRFPDLAAARRVGRHEPRSGLLGGLSEPRPPTPATVSVPASCSPPAAATTSPPRRSSTVADDLVGESRRGPAGRHGRDVQVGSSTTRTCAGWGRRRASCTWRSARSSTPCGT